MKIKNEFVKLKIGDKKYDFHNLILNEYIKKFVNYQTEMEPINAFNRRLQMCFIKFDEPLENITENSQVASDDFDIYLRGQFLYEQTLNKKQIEVQYSYELNHSDTVYDYDEEDFMPISDEKYTARKIAAIGFASLYSSNIDAVLDTSNYNIYIQQLQDISIVRKDVISTDGEFYSISGIDAPLHLAPYSELKYTVNIQIMPEDPIITQYIRYLYPQLYSIGFTNYPQVIISDEYAIGEDVNITTTDTEIIFNEVENNIGESPLICSPDVICNPSLKAKKDRYRYVVFKYRIYEMYANYGAYDDPFVATDQYYQIAIPISEFGRTNLKIKYERG